MRSMRTRMLSNPAVCVPLVRAARDLEFPVREAHQAERAKLSLRRPERLPGMWESKRGAPQDANSGTPNKRLIQLPSRFRLVLFSLVTSGRCATRCRFAASSCSAKRHRSAYKDTRPEWRERKHAGSAGSPACNAAVICGVACTAIVCCVVRSVAAGRFPPGSNAAVFRGVAIFGHHSSRVGRGASGRFRVHAGEGACAPGPEPRNGIADGVSHLA